MQVTYKGKKYRSISLACDFLGISPVTVCVRYKGIPVEQAFDKILENKRKYNCTDHLGYGFESKRAMAKFYNIPYDTLLFRLKSHWDLERALTTPKKRYNRGKQTMQELLIKKHNDFLKLQDIRTENMDDWHKRRYNGLGGSDVGTILGVNKYKTVHELWEEKTLRKEPPKQNHKMHFGHVLEDPIAKEFARVMGVKIRISNKQYKSENEPWLLGNVDRLITLQDKSKAVLECKNSADNTAFKDGYIFRNGEFYNGAKSNSQSIPLTYYCQCQHYMYITGIHKCYLACLIDGNDFRVYEVLYNQSDVNEIVQKATEFWFNNIIEDVEPERKLSDYDNTVNRIDAVRLDTNKELIAKNLIAEYLGCDANIKSLEKHRDEIKANLLGLVDTDIQEVLDSTGNTLYTIKSQTRNSFDKDKFKREHADLYPSYITQTQTKPIVTIKG